MSLFSSPLRVAPQCLLCTRRMLAAGWPTSRQWYPASNTTLEHARGKKTSSKSNDDVVVRLLKDMPGYGRSGSYIPVAPGTMRNSWAPRRLAEYIPREEQRLIEARRETIGRDVLFQADKYGSGKVSKRRRAMMDAALRAGGTVTVSPEELARQKREEERLRQEEEEARGVEKRFRVEVEGNKALDLMQDLLPPSLDFVKLLRSEGSQDIMGSVSLADVLVRIRSVLNDDSSSPAPNIALQEDDLRFVGGLAEDDKGDRLKAVGSYNLEISVKGEERRITRPVNVIGQTREQAQAQQAAEVVEAVVE